MEISIPSGSSPPSLGAPPRLSPNAPLEAFGGGESAARVSQGAANLNQGAVELAQKQQDEKDQMLLGQADLDLQKAKTSAMAQAMQLRGQNADQAVATGQKLYEDEVKSIYKNMTTPRQQASFRNYANNHAADLVTTLTNFKTTETMKWDKNTTDSRVTNYVNEGIQSGGNLKEIVKQEAQITTTWADYGRRMGWSNDEIDSNVRESLSVMHGGVIANYLSQGQYKLAQGYYKDHEGSIAEARKPSLMAELRAGAITDKSVEFWKQMGTTYRMENGNPDIEKMNAKIMGLPGYTDQEKLKIAENVKGLAYEQIRATAQHKEDQKEIFMDFATKARSSGVSLDQALQQVGKYADPAHPYDYALKTRMLQEVYGPAKESDPQTLLNFRNQLLAGPVDQSALDKAFYKDDKLSLADYVSLGGKNLKVTTKGISPADKFTETKINSMVAAEFKDDPQNQTRFIHYLEQATKGMQPQAKMEWAAKALGVDDSENPYKDMKIDWKSELKNQNAQTAQWSELNQTLGSEVVNAIGKGYSQSRGLQGKWEPSDISNFVDSMGGVEEFKPGTANYNAIQVLIKNGYPITEDILARYKLKYPQAGSQ